MKYILVLFFLTIAAHGRLGETPNECAQRYGIGMKDIGGGDDYFVTYFKNGFRIRIWFNKGKAAVILFAHSDESKKLTEAEIKTLLDANADGKLKILKNGDNWKKPEAKDYIIYELSKYLVVSNQECLLAFEDFLSKTEKKKLEGF